MIAEDGYGLITLIDHSGIVQEDNCICSQCKKPILKGEFYHRLGNKIYCQSCDFD